MMLGMAYLWKIFPMMYIIGGLFYNFYEFMSFAAPKLRKENIFVFFLALVISDSLVILAPFLHEWLEMVINTDARAWTEGGCRIHIWLSNIARDIPPWILVAAAYEKRAILWFPVPSDSQFSRFTAKLLVLVVLALCMVRHEHILWGPLYNSVVIANVTVTANASNRSTATPRRINEEVPKNVTVCDVTYDAFGIFMTLYDPWIDFLVRAFAPCVCLIIYNVSVLRKIEHEKYCAERLMEKVAIQPPSWFFSGVAEMENTIKQTAALTLLICVNSIPYSVYPLLQISYFGTATRFSPTFWTASNMLFYLNYCLIYPGFLARDHAMLAIIKDTWRLPTTVKRGTNVASLPPRIMPERSASSGSSCGPPENTATVGGVLSKVYNKVRDDEAVDPRRKRKKPLPQ